MNSNFKTPKKSSEVIKELEEKLKTFIDESNAFPNKTNDTLWENTLNDRIKACVNELHKMREKTDKHAFAELIKHTLLGARYIGSRVKLDDTQLETIAEETLDDWYFTNEQIKWLQEQQLFGTEDYL